MSEAWQDHVMTQPPQRPLRNVPIFRTVGQAVSLLFGNFGALLRAAALPALLSLLIGLAQWYLLPKELRTLALDETQPFHWSHVLSVLSLVPYVLFAVAWHRALLLGPQAGRPEMLPAWKGRHWIFLGYVILTTIIFIVAMLIPGIFIALGATGMQQLAGQEQGIGQQTTALELGLGFAALIAIVVAISAWLRLLLVLPARAVDERFGLRNAWRLGRGQGWRLLVIHFLMSFIGLLVAGLAAVPLALALYVPAALIWGFTAEASAFVGALSQVFLGYPLTALFVGVLSIAFRTVSGWVPSAQDPGPPVPA